MAREEKVQAVSDIKSSFETADAVFITEFSGLTVGEQQALRRGLREGDTDYRVVKMSLARRAVEDLDIEGDLTELLFGPTALAFTGGDPVSAAKTLKAFAAEHDALQIKGLVFSGEVLAPEKVSELAALDTREVMLSRVAGMLAAPLTNMAGLMAAFTRNAASMFAQLRDRLEAEGDPNATEAPAAAETEPAEEAVTDEAPADEAADASDDATEAPAAAEAEPAEEAVTDEAPADEAADASDDAAEAAPTEESTEEAPQGDDDTPDDPGEEE